MIKFDEIAQGASYYFNVNWSPGGGWGHAISEYHVMVHIPVTAQAKIIMFWLYNEVILVVQRVNRT